MLDNAHGYFKQHNSFGAMAVKQMIPFPSRHRTVPKAGKCTPGLVEIPENKAGVKFGPLSVCEWAQGTIELAEPWGCPQPLAGTGGWSAQPVVESVGAARRKVAKGRHRTVQAVAAAGTGVEQFGVMTQREAIPSWWVSAATSGGYLPEIGARVRYSTHRPSNGEWAQ